MDNPRWPRTTVRQVFAGTLVDLSRVVEHLRAVLGAARFDECVAAGAAMELSDAVRYAHEQIQLARTELVS